MSNVSFRLVQNRSFVAATDDLAAVLLFSVAGLMTQLFVFVVAFKSIIG